MPKRALHQRGNAILSGKLDTMHKLRKDNMRQFDSISGFMPGRDVAFDDFVRQKREERAFDEFDQRVERAYQVANRLHKAEIWNGIKRKLKNQGTKFNYTVMLDANRAVEERGEWLRDVFAQIDADYRSEDPERQGKAATDISKALRGEPFDYMSWVYEHQRHIRHKGPKGRAVNEAQEDEQNMPTVSNEEATRYHNLRLSMSHIEDAVIDRFGVAGREHWDILQQNKDEDYLVKMFQAAGVHQDLKDQEAAHHEAKGVLSERKDQSRIQRAQVRFKAAMEVEDERARLFEAHDEMNRIRAAAAKESHKKSLLRMQELRAEGKTPTEMQNILKQETIDRVAQDQGTTMRQEQQEQLQRRKKFLNLLDEVEAQFERNDGQTLLRSSNADRETGAQQESRELMDQARYLAESRGISATPSTTKKALWEVINEDRFMDPFRVVHQARVLATQTYDEIYRNTKAYKLRMGKHMNKTFGDVGDAKQRGYRERSILNDLSIEVNAFHWGVSSRDMFNMDSNGQNKYYEDVTGFHRMDSHKDLDQTKEKRLGRGAMWAKPQLYRHSTYSGGDNYKKIGADPKDRPMK